MTAEQTNSRTEPSIGKPVSPTRGFRRALGLAQGIPKHRLDGPTFRPLFHTIRIRADVSMTPVLWGRAALLAIGEHAVVSHHTAAEMLGGVVPHQVETHVTVRQAGRRPKIAGIRAHLSRSPVPTQLLQGVRVTTAQRTFLDLAGVLGLVDLVVLGDSLVRAGCCAAAELVDAAAEAHGRNVTLARRAASLVRGGVDSPMETRSRMLMVLAGLPEPDINIVILEDGEVVFRLDMGHVTVRAGIEYDGRQHAEDDHQWGHDVGRREYLDGKGWRLVILRSGDIYRTPRATLQRIVDVLRSRGLEVPMPRPGAEWERYFPGR